MRQKHIIAAASVILALTTAALPAPPETTAASVSARIDALVQKYVEFGYFNGSILVARGAQIIIEKGYGMADFEWSIPNAPDTCFRLGSLTKQFTSLLIMQLVDDGMLSLEDRLADRLPYYRSETGSKVTIHQLLNHTSGIPDYANNPNLRDRSRLPLSPRELVTTYCSGDLEFEPGSRFAYTNSGYVILGAVIEEITGKAYEQVLRERIFNPVGMKSTGYDTSGSLVNHRAAGYENRLDGMRNADFVDMSLPYSAGALYSTVDDLYLWDQALYGTKLLSGAGMNKMFAPGPGSYACGWFVRKAPLGPDRAERTVFQHTGNINGFSSLIARIPEDHVVVVLLNNTGGVPLTLIAQGIGDIVYEREPQPPKRSIARVLHTTIREQGIDAAVAQYREIKANRATDYDLDDEELHQLGYSLLRNGAVDNAIAIFRLNVESFPGAWNPFDSLGEAYAVKGDKELAIKNYARSIELNPSNVNGIKRLQALAGK